jgi:phenylacetate-CoA ligase
MSRPTASPALDLAPHASKSEQLYARLPRGLQSAALSLEGWRQRRERYGGDFRARLAAYARLERASEDEVHAVRRDKLRALLRHAAASIPHWRETFREAGLDPERVHGPEDLSGLPVLTKADILRLGTRLTWAEAPKGEIRKVHTSGTTGAGLVFLTTRDAVRDQWAVWWRYRARLGLDVDTWQGTFAGRSIVPGDMNDSRPWRVNVPGRQVLFSQYHLRPGTVASYVREMARRGLPWLQGYPSFLTHLATLIAQAGLQPLRPRTITFGAENVLPAQSRIVEEVFGSVPHQHYGLAEMVANASECPAGRLHIDEDFASVELLPSVDGTCRIIGTSLQNLAMPFIRYDTGDLARVASEPCACGLPGRVLDSIDGRREDLLELKDGAMVGRLDHLFKDAVRVAEAQIRQPERGRCTIAIVPRPGFGDADREALLAECRARFGDRLDVEIILVEALPRTSRGKLRLVVREPAAR